MIFTQISRRNTPDIPETQSNLSGLNLDFIGSITCVQKMQDEYRMTPMVHGVLSIERRNICATIIR